MEVQRVCIPRGVGVVKVGPVRLGVRPYRGQCGAWLLVGLFHTVVAVAEVVDNVAVVEVVDIAAAAVELGRIFCPEINVKLQWEVYRYSLGMALNLCLVRLLFSKLRLTNWRQ